MRDTLPDSLTIKRNYRNYALCLIIGLLLVRLIALRLSPYGLHGDEAQYWAWAQDLDWGYFSKPPMIAWIIASTTAIFGDAEWAARLASPIIHSGTAFLIFLTGRKAFSPQAGFWACAVYSLMPAVWVSSMIISTDVALLFFWALGLHAWVSLRAAPSWRFAVQLGLALGFGMMSKYAMMFFIPPLIIASIWDTPTRRALINLKGATAIMIAGLIIAPNIWWNISHDFATVTHTAANTNLEGKSVFFHPSEFLKFFGDQFGVFGPIPFILLLITFTGIRQFRPKTTPIETHTTQPLFYCIIFALTPLLIISIQAFLSRANANWAVSAYPSAALVLGAVATHFPFKKTWRKTWLRRGLFIQSLFCSFLLIASLSPQFVNKLGVANSVKRLRAWPQTVAVIQTQFSKGHEGRQFESIVFDHRLMFYDMNYYSMADTAPIFIWQQSPTPKNHAELTQSLKQQGDAPILLINRTGNIVPNLGRDFTRVEELDEIEINLGGGKTRKFKTWAVYGYNSPIRQ